MAKSKRGFTLLELLIVIAILAILSAVTIIVLNPAELLKKARDSQRISDISTIKTAIGYYLITTSSPALFVGTTECSDQATKTVFTHRAGVSVGGTWTTDATTTQVIDGTGWIEIDLGSLSGGSPLAKYPIDPSNSGPAAGANDDLYYTYTCNNTNTTFELNANMESIFYRTTGGGDVESNTKDGGDQNTLYEDGTALTLLPNTTSATYYSGE